MSPCKGDEHDKVTGISDDWRTGHALELLIRVFGWHLDCKTLATSDSHPASPDQVSPDQHQLKGSSSMCFINLKPVAHRPGCQTESCPNCGPGDSRLTISNNFAPEMIICGSLHR